MKEDGHKLAMTTKELNSAASSKPSSTTSSLRNSLEHNRQSPVVKTASAVFRPVTKTLLFIWHWSVPYRSANRKIDPTYAAIWRTSLDEQNIRDVVHAALPTIPIEQLPIDEEGIRTLVRTHHAPPQLPLDEKADATDKADSVEDLERKRLQLLNEFPEETWVHLPVNLRELLAALNAHNLEKKVDLLSGESYHPKAGQGSLKRSNNGIHKTFRMWRLGFFTGVSRFERFAVYIFIPFLAFSACYPDIAAGFLGERSYNQRSIGSRIATLCQLFSLTMFPYHSFWLLFNWSLERLIGAFVGNTVYALAAIVPAIHQAYGTQWFRFTLLGLSMAWQVGVQFTPTIRDYIVRLITRRQMRRLREQGDTEAINWTEVDATVKHELMTTKTFIKQQSQPDATFLSWSDVPYRTRVERFIKFTALYSLGRPADQLVGLLKDDMEVIVNTYQDYQRSSAPSSAPPEDKGHVEPPLPKIILVIFDAAIFAYICYSFWTQPFTFNTTVAYGTVVVLKQAVIAAKRYQTAKSARRLFTNMVAFNILGVFLVSTPVTVNRHVLDDTGRFVGLTLAMVFATLFLAEMIAPILLKTVESAVGLFEKKRSKGQEKDEKAGG